jgi:serine/threonine-protein kinase HipA
MSQGKVYFKNKLSGLIDKKADGTFEFSYSNDSESVSLTLPNTQTLHQAEELFPFFDGLIPEGWLLTIAEKNWKIPKNDRWTLLLTACQDCIGAAHVLGAETKNEPTQSSIHHKAHTFSSEQCLVCMEALNADNDLYHKHCAQKTFGFSHTPIVDISLHDLEKLALLQINQRLTLTGVQKKLSLSTIAENKKERLTVVGVDGRFILKPSTEEYPEMAEIEHLSMKMAESLGIPVAQCGLVFLSNGEKAYITRRFDRIKDEKIQVEDFCQLSQKSTAKKYTGSSEALGKVIDQYSDQPQDDKLTLFEILLFSFWIGNADMHLKNFSLWRDPRSQLIRMSPGYDFVSTRLLIPSSQDSEELALPINGRKNKLRWSDFLAFGNHLKIPLKVQERVREKMLNQFFECEALIQQSFLSESSKEAFADLLIERSERLSQG